MLLLLQRFWPVACLVLGIGFITGCDESFREPDVGLVHWELHHAPTQRWLPVHVPGDVMTDLLEHGLIEDPFHGVNETHLQWIENENWTYRTQVSAADYPHHAVLRLNGLDTYARVTVNDSLLLETSNAHRAYEVPLPADAAHWDIEIHFDPAVARGQEILNTQPRVIPVSNEIKPVGTQTSSVTRKPYYHFGWDWGPRFVSAGISGAVTIAAADQPQASQNRIATEISSNGSATIAFQPAGNWPDGAWHVEHPDGSSSSPSASETPHEWKVQIPEAELWWPNGMGDQPLYRLIWTPDDSDYCGLEWNIGLRTIEWVRERDEWGRSFACQVNGVPMHARGANLIPADFFPVRGWETELDRLQSAVDANMNMVRIWGGATYPSEQFFDFCDANGLLVWQDFMFACAMVPEDSAYVENVREEALHQVKRLRHRPSLALWCGNNESRKAWKTWGWPDVFDLHGADSVATEAAYDHMFHEILPKIVATESNTTYWPSSPMPDPLESENIESGDEHAWHVWFDTLDFDFYSRQAGRFVSEYGLQSLPEAATLARAGVTAFSDTALQFRQRSAMEWLKPGLDGWGMMRIYARRYAADPAAPDPSHTPLERWIYLTQYTQSLGLREGLERHRTSGGRYAGSLYWQLSDVWPTVSWSTVDYDGRWKMAHYAVQRANKPRCIQRVHHQERLALSAFNEYPEAIKQSALHVALLDARGDTIATDMRWVDLDSFSHAHIDLDQLAEDRWALIRWKWLDSKGSLIDAGEHLRMKPAEIQWPDASILWELTTDTLYLTSDAVAMGVKISMDGFHFHENDLVLYPGETRAVAFKRLEHADRLESELSIEHFAQFQ